MVNDTDEIMLITDGGILVRTRVKEISVVGRNTQGVTVIRLDKGERVVGVDRIDGLGDEDDDAEGDIDETDVPADSDRIWRRRGINMARIYNFSAVRR